MLARLNLFQMDLELLGGFQAMYHFVPPIAE